MTTIVISTPGVNLGEGLKQAFGILKNLLPTRSSAVIDRSQVSEWSQLAIEKYRPHLVRPDATTGWVARREEKKTESRSASGVQVQTWSSPAVKRLFTPKIMSIAVSSSQAAAIYRDAVAFCAALPANLPPPRVSISREGDISLRWERNGKQAVADFEGDGAYGYALLRDGRFVPGQHDVNSPAEIPSDLISYLEDLASRNG